MQNTKLIQLLKSLDTSEFREFKDFVVSPVFNKNKKVIKLFDSIKNHYPDFDSALLKDEIIFRKVFPGEKYDYFKIKNIISDLFSLGKEYLAFFHYRDVSDIKNKFLLEQLRDRSLDSIFEQTHKSYGKQLENTKIKDESYILKCLELTEEMHSFRIPKDPSSRLGFFQKELDYFLKYCLIRLLKFYNIMLHEKLQNNYDFDMKMLDEVLEYMEKNKDETNPALLIYYNIIKINMDKDEKAFYELKKLKDVYFDEINNADIYMIFLYMANYCAYVFNNLGRTDFMYEHFLITKENFDKGTIILGKVLYPDFLNHVKIAARVKEFEWAENYISKFQHLLTEEKDSTLKFCHGYINYLKGNLDEAMDLLSRTNFSNFIIKIQVKILLLQIYYEKEFYEQVLSMIDTFRHFLSRENSILEESKESFYDYLRIVNDLVKLKMSIDTKDVKYSLSKISSGVDKVKINQFGIKNWLKERVSGFKF